jgi:hypothetical protein
MKALAGQHRNQIHPRQTRNWVGKNIFKPLFDFSRNTRERIDFQRIAAPVIERPDIYPARLHGRCAHELAK